MPLRLPLLKRRKTEDPALAADQADSRLPADEAEEDQSSMRKRRVVRLTTIVFVALAAGQFVQSSQRNGGGTNALAATTRDTAMLSAKTTQPKAVLTPVILAKAQMPQISAGVGSAATSSVVRVSATPESNVVAPVQPEPAAAATCEDKLNLTLDPGAMLGLLLVAPCHENQRVSLHHAGLAFTGKTDAAGTLRLALPALSVDGTVEAVFSDGTKLQSAIAVPDLSHVRRLAVQWQSGESFALHGLEGGANLADTGDVWAAHPGQLPSAADIPKGGWLVALGDASVTAPLFAEVYTYPADPSQPAEVAIEATVNATTCGHDLLGQTLASAGGTVSITDLTLSMPDCDGQTGYLVLKNLFPDMKIAASN